MRQGLVEACGGFIGGLTEVIDKGEETVGGGGRGGRGGGYRRGERGGGVWGGRRVGGRGGGGAGGAMSHGFGNCRHDGAAAITAINCTAASGPAAAAPLLLFTVM